MDVTIDNARELVADASLWPLVRDFLWDFAPQIHPTWIEGLNGEGQGSNADDSNQEQSTTEELPENETPKRQTFPALVPNLQDSPRVKRFILDSLGVEPCFHAFPKDDWSRLLLLDGATLASIAKWLGALACADALRKVTDGAVVRGLKAGLPGVYPEVFGYTAYFNLSSDFHNAEAQSAQRISEEGCKMLFSVLSKLPKPLIRRMELKFPKGLCELCLSAPLREIKHTVILKLLKLKFPEAYNLCC